MAPASPPATEPNGRTAVICGIGGQDGAYLAAHLLALGYAVIGTSRDAHGRFEGLTTLGIRDRVAVVSMSLVDFRSTFQALKKAQPDEIYNLAGQSSVGLSFDQPVETFESIVVGTINLLEAIRLLGRPVRLYNAGSSEMFGNAGEEPASEIPCSGPGAPMESPRRPRSGRSPNIARPTASPLPPASSSITKAHSVRNAS